MVPKHIDKTLPQEIFLVPRRVTISTAGRMRPASIYIENSTTFTEALQQNFGGLNDRMDNCILFFHYCIPDLNPDFIYNLT